MRLFASFGYHKPSISKVAILMIQKLVFTLFAIFNIGSSAIPACVATSKWCISP